jgi:hypothetical protein
MPELDLLRRLGDQIVPPPLEELRQVARHRTRRTAAVTSIAAVAVLVAVLAGVNMTATDPRTAAPVHEPEQHLRPLSYADGSTLHYGDRSVSALGRVVELDLTDDGVVFRTADDRIWFTDGSDPEQVGALGETGPAWAHADFLWGDYVGRMVSGNSGSEAAWFEFPRPGSPEVVIYDTRAREVVGRHELQLPGDAMAGLYSVDAEAVYGFTDLMDDEDPWPNWRMGVTYGSQSPLDRGEYQDILEKRSGARILEISHHEEDELADYEPFDGLQQFSVTGPRVRPEGEQPLFVRDALTGTELRFSAPDGYPATNPVWLVQWVDDDTVILDAEQRERIDLLECRISTGACTVAVRVSSDAVLPEIG